MKNGGAPSVIIQLTINHYGTIVLTAEQRCGKMRLIDVDELWKDITSEIDDCSDVLDIIERQPMADPVKHGKWWSVKLLDDEADFGEVDGAQCSECGYAHESEYWAKTYFKFCPNCGAKMDGKEE